MDELCSIFQNLAVEDVQTYIRSGNVVFRSKNTLDDTFSEKVSNDIEALRGFKPAVFILSLAEFEGAVRANPFKNNDGKLVHFYFLKEKTENYDLAQLHLFKSPTEDFSLIDKVFYLYTPDGFQSSKVARKVEKAIDMPMTARNLNTVNKMHGLVTFHG